MPILSQHFELSTCPHCSIANPLLAKRAEFDTKKHSGQNVQFWRIYACASCGGVVSAYADKFELAAKDWFPDAQAVNEDLPEKAKAFLQQAIDSLHAPAGAVMLSASAVDAMSKEKSFKDGSLYSRIDKAVEDGVITSEMATWAHEIRLDANDQRHADDNAGLPSQPEAERCIEFAKALGQFMFVLPARISRGIASTNE